MSFYQHETLPPSSVLALIPIGPATSPALQEQSSWFPACLLYLHRIWSSHHVPNLPLFALWAVKETSLHLLLCCRLASLASHRSPVFPLSRQNSAGCLQCHWYSTVVSLHCSYSAELLYSVRSTAHHLPAFSFPHYSCFFWDGGVSWCWLPNYSRQLFGGKESVRFYHLAAVACKHLTSCILDSSGHCALSWLWKHMDEVNGSL